MEDYIEKLKESVYQHAHPEKQAAMAKYMRNQFSFLGRTRTYSFWSDPILSTNSEYTWRSKGLMAS